MSCTVPQLIRNTTTRLLTENHKTVNVIGNHVYVGISPDSKIKTLDQAREFAKRLMNKVHNYFEAEKFGNILSFANDKPIPNTVSMYINIPQKLIDGYEKKYGKQGNIFNQGSSGEDNLNTNEVNYALKAVDILKTQKADEIFRKGDKNNWNIDKILQELQVPKEQQELIKSFGTRNREEILTSLLANYSYTIEINTSKQEHDGDRTDYWFENKDFFYSLDQDSGKYYKWSKKTNEHYTPLEPEFEVTKEQYFKELRDLQSKPTQYYTNLTVPGGTNYTENEIATPAITPSIKGHAQFSTPEGIMWTRTDEREIYELSDTERLISIMEKSGVLQIKCK